MMDVNQSRVYDLLHPSPVSLKEIAAASLALEICREEINKYRRINALNRLRFDRISLDGLLPIIPSTIHNLFKECKRHVESSIEHFIKMNYNYVFKIHHKDMNEVLKDFDDFVVDYDATINHCKTAKRVILCDRFSDVEKFVLACKFSFAEDIVKLWPSVSTIIKMDDFEDNKYLKYTSLRYWVDRLKSNSNDFGSTDGFWGEQLLKEAIWNMPSTLEYFWEKIDSIARVRIVIEHFDKFYNSDWFCRYMLPKFSEQELDVFMFARGGYLIPNLLTFYSMWSDLVFPVWKLLKNKITVPDFILIVRKLIETQTNDSRFFDSSDCGVKIWEDAAVEMKQAAIKDIISSSDSSIFVRSRYNSCRQTGFLLKLLSDMTIEERRTFWNKNWSHLVSGTRTKDLQVLMNLCIGSRKKINKFKRIRLTRYKVIGPCCLQFLKDANFEELDKFLNFCCSREETRKSIKSRLLYNDFKLSYVHLHRARLLDNFIKSTFDDEDEITKFKYDLSWRLTGNDYLPMTVRCEEFDQLKELLDTIVISEEVAVFLKKNYFPNVIRSCFTGSMPSFYNFQGEKLSNFLRWCFGDEEKVEQFKQSLPIDEIVRAVANKDNEVLSEDSLYKKERPCHDYDFDAFLEWYFTDPESLAEFKTRFADLFEQIGQK